VARCVDVGVTIVLFFATGVLGVSSANGLSVTVLVGVPPHVSWLPWWLSFVPLFHRTFQHE
jgi:hypothetical protein